MHQLLLMLVIFLAPFSVYVIVVAFQKFLLQEEIATVQCAEFGMCVYYVLMIRKFH